MDRMFSMSFTVGFDGQPYAKLIKRFSDQDGITYFGYDVSNAKPGRVEVFIDVKPHLLPLARRIIGSIPTASDILVASPLPVWAEKPPGEVLMVIM